MKSKFRIYSSNGYWFVEEYKGWFKGWGGPSYLHNNGYKTSFETQKEAENAIDQHRKWIEHYKSLDKKRVQEKKNSIYKY